jgi:hypothetical protein
MGYHGRPLYYHGLSLILEFAYSIEFGLHPCSLRIRLECLTGGSCLSSPWRAAGSVQYPASLPQIHQVRGIPQERFPYQGRYPPATRPDMVEDDGDNNNVDGVKTGRFLIGAFQVQAPSGHFVLHLGSFGHHLVSFREKGFLRDTPGLPLGRPWGLGASSLCVGAAGGLRFFPFLA